LTNFPAISCALHIIVISLQMNKKIKLDYNLKKGEEIDAYFAGNEHPTADGLVEVVGGDKSSIQYV
jgi:hypothetical protein